MASVDVPGVAAPLAQPASPRTGFGLRLGAEFLGTFLIVLVGAGVIMLANNAAAPLPAPMAAGLAIVAAVMAFGRISGGHFNPLFSIASALTGRTSWIHALGYILAQFVAGILGTVVLLVIVLNVDGLPTQTVFNAAASGFGEHSGFHVQLPAVLMLEVIGAAVLAGVFLAGSRAAEKGSLLTLALGTGLTTVVLGQLAQGVSNSLFNPARALAVSLFSNPWAGEQLWVFLAAPVLGAVLAGLISRLLFGPSDPSALGALGAGDADDVVAADVAQVPGSVHGVSAAAPQTAAASGTGTAPETIAQSNAGAAADGRTGEVQASAADTEHAEARDFFERPGS